MSQPINFDVDIDVADRTQLLSAIPHVPASILQPTGEYVKHNTGVYFQTIPQLPVEQISAIDYKSAQQQGWFKVDILNNSIYRDIVDEAHLDRLCNTEPMWELLQHREVVEQLFHINKHYDILLQYRPTCIEQLAMLLAIIRPGKRYLVGKNWDKIAQQVWVKPSDDSYYFKHSHAISYALAIVVQLNLLCEKLNQSDGLSD
jgi:hypothetical protein